MIRELFLFCDLLFNYPNIRLMDSFYLSVEEITELASYRVPFESKLRILIPDKGDTTKDTLAVKLKSLNYILSPSERNASMKFRYDIQQLAHGINPFNSQDGLKKFKSNHKTVTEVIDRLIGRSHHYLVQSDQAHQSRCHQP